MGVILGFQVEQFRVSHRSSGIVLCRATLAGAHLHQGSHHALAGLYQLLSRSDSRVVDRTIQGFVLCRATRRAHLHHGGHHALAGLLEREHQHEDEDAARHAAPDVEPLRRPRHRLHLHACAASGLRNVTRPTLSLMLFASEGLVSATHKESGVDQRGWSNRTMWEGMPPAQCSTILVGLFYLTSNK